MPEEDLAKKEGEVLNSSTPPSQPITQNNVAPQAPSQLSKPLIIILGIATFWQTFYIGTAFLLLSLYIFVILIKSSGLDAPLPTVGGLLTKQLFDLVYIFLYPTIILVFGLLFIYIKNVYKNEKVLQNEKVMWVIILIFLSPITMPIYWYRYICDESKRDSLPWYKFRYSYIPILYALVFLTIPVIFVIDVYYAEVQRAEDQKKQQLALFENAQSIGARLPAILKSEWNDPEIDSRVGGVVKVTYFQHDFQYESLATDNIKIIYIVEIKSPKTDLKCNHETYLELDKTVTGYRRRIEGEWLSNCDELSIYNEKGVFSKYEGSNEYNSFFEKEITMIFDKGNTRIFLYYEQHLEDILMSAENWTKSDLIKVAENLRPVDKKDFGL